MSCPHPPHSEITFLSPQVLSLECDTKRGYGILYDHADTSKQSDRLFGVFIQLVKKLKIIIVMSPPFRKPKLHPCFRLYIMYFELIFHFKTWDIYGFVFCEKTAHFKVAFYCPQHRLYISIVSRNHICLSKSAISATVCFFKAVNEAEWTVSLPDKATLIARCSSGKDVLVLKRKLCCWESFIWGLTVCGYRLSLL
jgi:hypothetical protein